MAMIQVDLNEEVRAAAREILSEFIERLNKVENEVRNNKQYKRWMRQRDVADYLGISVTTLKAIIEKFDDFPKPTYLSDVNVVYDRDEIDTWMKKHRRVGGTSNDSKYE